MFFAVGGLALAAYFVMSKRSSTSGSSVRAMDETSQAKEGKKEVDSVEEGRDPAPPQVLNRSPAVTRGSVDQPALRNNESTRPGQLVRASVTDHLLVPSSRSMFSIESISTGPSPSFDQTPLFPTGLASMRGSLQASNHSLMLGNMQRWGAVQSSGLVHSPGMTSLSFQGSPHPVSSASGQNMQGHKDTGLDPVFSFSAVPSFTNMQSNPGSQSTTLAGPYRTCQGEIKLWKQIEVRADKVERKECIGSGSFADVFKGFAFNTDVAIKLYKKNATGEQLKQAVSIARREATDRSDAVETDNCIVRLGRWPRSSLHRRWIILARSVS